MSGFQHVEPGYYIYESSHNIKNSMILQCELREDGYWIRFWDSFKVGKVGRMPAAHWKDWKRKEHPDISKSFVKIPEEHVPNYIAKWRLLG